MGTDTYAAAQENSPAIRFRAPANLHRSSSASFSAPAAEFLQGTWYASHSTMQMWKSNQNITITYTVLDSPAGSIDDLMQYQPAASNKQKSVHGVDTPDPQVAGRYTWRGTGWMKVWSTQWEILAFGDEEEGWMLTYFSKSMFSAAGIHIYTRAKNNISTSLLQSIKAEIEKVDDHEFRGLIDQVFEVKQDRA